MKYLSIVIVLIVSFNSFSQVNNERKSKIEEQKETFGLAENSEKENNSNEIKESVDDLKNEIQELKSKLDKLTNKSVKFGLSIGYREVNRKFLGDYQSASISPIDSTLTLENYSKESVVLSTSVVITPFIRANWLKEKKAIINKKKENLNNAIDAEVINKKASKPVDNLGNKRAERLVLLSRKAFFDVLGNIGIQANLNLIEFTEAQENFTFNKSIQGGLGLSYRLTDKIYFSYHNELFFSRQLRQHLKNRVGQKIFDTDGNVVSSINSLDKTNEDYYITKNVIGSIYRIIIVF